LCFVVTKKHFLNLHGDPVSAIVRYNTFNPIQSTGGGGDLNSKAPRYLSVQFPMFYCCNRFSRTSIKQTKVFHVDLEFKLITFKEVENKIVSSSKCYQKKKTERILIISIELQSNH